MSAVKNASLVHRKSHSCSGRVSLQRLVEQIASNPSHRRLAQFSEWFASKWLSTRHETYLTEKMSNALITYV